MENFKKTLLLGYTLVYLHAIFPRDMIIWNVNRSFKMEWKWWKSFKQKKAAPLMNEPYGRFTKHFSLFCHYFSLLLLIIVFCIIRDLWLNKNSKNISIAQKVFQVQKYNKKFLICANKKVFLNENTVILKTSI